MFVLNWWLCSCKINAGCNLKIINRLHTYYIITYSAILFSCLKTRTLHGSRGWFVFCHFSRVASSVVGVPPTTLRLFLSILICLPLPFVSVRSRDRPSNCFLQLSKSAPTNWLLTSNDYMLTITIYTIKSWILSFISFMLGEWFHLCPTVRAPNLTSPDSQDSAI